MIYVFENTAVWETWVLNQRNCGVRSLLAPVIHVNGLLLAKRPFSAAANTAQM